jgi:Lysozyme like domain
MAAPVLPLAVLGTGLYLAWYGVHYWRSSSKWPTDPVKSILQGKGLPAPSGQTSAAGLFQTAAAATPSAPGGVASAVGAAGAAPAVSGAYTLAALETLWTSQGGSSNTAFEAANIAMAESSGEPAVTSSNPDGGTNVGLWQLDTKGVGAGYTVAQLQDPATNARITIMATANGTNWSEWADAVVSNGVYTGPKV